MLTVATPGVPRSTPKPGGTIEGIRHAHALGIKAIEIEWVQRVPSNAQHMESIRKTASELNFSLTVHAPYFVNLNASDKSKREASKKRILDALSMAQIAGAASVCVHAAFYQGSSPKEAYDRIRRETESMLRQKNRMFPNVNLAYETMGKHSQWGTLEEVLSLSREFGIYPCVDLAHMHARSNGAINSTPEWNTVLDQYEESLGAASLRQMHLHYSGIAYGSKGEKHHLPFQESDAAWQEFLQVLKKRDIGGILVCESPLMEQDTLLLQEYYDQL